MTARVLFVSVRQSFDPSDPSSSVAQLEPWVERAWCIGVEKAATCDRVVAVQVGAPLAAWRIRDAFPTDETYNVGGTTRRRVGLSLGDPLPILAAYSVVPALRHGVAIAVCPVEPLPIERQARGARRCGTRAHPGARRTSRFRSSRLCLSVAGIRRGARCHRPVGQGVGEGGTEHRGPATRGVGGDGRRLCPKQPLRGLLLGVSGLGPARLDEPSLSVQGGNGRPGVVHGDVLLQRLWS